MDIKEIQNLIKFVSKSGVEEVKIEREDFKITIKTKKNMIMIHFYLNILMNIMTYFWIKMKNF